MLILAISHPAHQGALLYLKLASTPDVFPGKTCFPPASVKFASFHYVRGCAYSKWKLQMNVSWFIALSAQRFVSCFCGECGPMAPSITGLCLVQRSPGRGKGHDVEKTVLHCWLSPYSAGMCFGAAKPGPWGAGSTRARAQAGCCCLTEFPSTEPRVKA